MQRQPAVSCQTVKYLIIDPSHLVRLPVPEKVDRTVDSPLDDGPAAGVVSLVAPHLHETVGVLGLQKEHAAGGVSFFQSLQTVPERT